MDDTTPKVETVTPEAPSNNAPSTAAPAANAVDSAEVERLRKEAEQATLRANQLANQLKAKEDAEAAAQAKKLEEEGQYKELLEKERAEKNALIEEKAAAERDALLSQGTNEVLSKYSPAVVEIARTAGLSLVDDSDEAKASLSEKLDAIAAKVGGTARVEANNPPTSPQTGEPKEELLATMSNPDLRPRERDAATSKLISGLATVKAMKEQAGYRELSE